MQLIVTILVLFFFIVKFDEIGGWQILIALIIEHVFSYICSWFRKWELKKYGVLDINGVMRAPKESFL